MPLSNDAVDAINENINHLMRNESTIELLPSFIAKGILSDDDVKLLDEKTDCEHKIELLLEILKRKEKEQFHQFCTILQLSEDEIVRRCGSHMLNFVRNIKDRRNTTVVKKRRSYKRRTKSDIIHRAQCFAELAQKHECILFVWGNNNFYQLGSRKYEKLRVPVANKILADLEPLSIAGGANNTYIVSSFGKVHQIGKAVITEVNNNNENHKSADIDTASTPQQMHSLNNAFVTEVIMHPDGEYVLAITSSGELYTWGYGPLGRNTTCDAPHVVKALAGKEIIRASCSSTHCAAVTTNGKLYTWGEGKYGALGHGDYKSYMKPKKVKAFSDMKVKNVACGGTNISNFTVAITSDGKVWTWGDGKLGKIGRDDSYAAYLPANLDSLNDKHIIKIVCSCSFTLALTSNGEIYAWGFSDILNPGFFKEHIIPYPYKLEIVSDLKIADIAVGCSHCTVCTTNGEVYTWGYNDNGQLGNGSHHEYVHKLCHVIALKDVQINRVACGFSHVIAWQLKS